MKLFVVFSFCCALTIAHARPEVAAPASNNANKPQPTPSKRPVPLWTSGKVLTLLIALSFVIGGLLFCCCFQFSCSITLRNFTEENTALLPKPSRLGRKFQSENHLERWE